MDYNKKVDLLKKLSYAYYVLDDPIASDDEYDRVYHEVKAFEEQNPDKVDPSSPTQRVGNTILGGFEKSKHIQRMWSLDDVFNLNELQEWLNRITRVYPEAKFTCSPKFDGASLNLLYIDGNLQKATTRGDGFEGELVTQNAKTIQSIPLKIPHKGELEIRGEVVISKQDFLALNEQRALDSLSLFANPRNASAGSLRQLDPKITAKRKLQFIPWGVGEHSLGENSYFEILKLLSEFGFLSSPFTTLCKDQNDIQAIYTKILSQKEQYPIMLDGMVVALDDIALQNKLGFTIKSPRFSCAYKFPAVEKSSKILDITLQVGRSGVVTPVAELEKVEIEGAIISRATLHNFSEIKRKDIRIGDKVIIIRSGDVIPKIIKPLVALRDGTQKAIITPTHCPECGNELLVEEIFIKCQNLACKARVIESIIHFASKKALNIDGMGEKIVYQLYKEGLISNIEDIYNLKEEDLLSLEGWQNKRVTNLLNSIQSTKGVALWRFINALGIEHIGEGASKKLDNAFGLEAFTQDLETLQVLDGFGIEMAKSVIDFVHANKQRIQTLLEIITPLPSQKQAINKDNPFFDKTIVITGTLSIGRDELKSKLESIGAKITSSISKKTDILICGKDAGSKLEKAQTLGVKILYQEDLESMLVGVESHKGVER